MFFFSSKQIKNVFWNIKKNKPLHIQFEIPPKCCVHRPLSLSVDATARDVKGVDSICESSLISLLRLSATSQPHFCGETAVCTWICMCVRACTHVCVCDLNALPFTDLKTHSFWVRVKPQEEVDSFDLLLLSSRFHSLVVWYHFTGSPDFPESPRGHVAHLLTLLPLEPEGNFPWCGVKTASCHSHLPLIKDWNQGREKVRSLVKVEKNKTENSTTESW